MQIREIASPAAGDQNLSPRLPVVFEYGHSPPALRSGNRAHQPSRACAQHNHIELARGGMHGVYFRIAAKFGMFPHPIVSLVYGPKPRTPEFDTRTRSGLTENLF
jgi:hypothetical protein